jgi:hypothetical protein
MMALSTKAPLTIHDCYYDLVLSSKTSVIPPRYVFDHEIPSQNFGDKVMRSIHEFTQTIKLCLQNNMHKSPHSGIENSKLARLERWLARCDAA